MGPGGHSNSPTAIGPVPKGTDRRMPCPNGWHNQPCPVGQAPAAHAAHGWAPAWPAPQDFTKPLTAAPGLSGARHQEVSPAPDSAPSPQRTGPTMPTLASAGPSHSQRVFRKFPSALLVTTSGHDPKRCPLRGTNSDDSNARSNPRSRLTLVLPKPQNSLQSTPSNLL